MVLTYKLMDKIIYVCVFLVVFLVVYLSLTFIVEPYIIYTVCKELVICNGSNI